MQRNYIRASLQLVQVIRPLRHHGAAVLDELGVVARCAQRAWYAVRKLMLNDFGRDADLLMQDRARHGAEVVTRNFCFGVVTHAPKRRVYCSVAHRSTVCSRPRKHVTPLPRQRVQLSQRRHRLGREGDEMLGLGLRCDVAPFGLVQIESRPFGLA